MKIKYLYNGYGIAFAGVLSWSFSNIFSRNLVSFSVDNSSSRYFRNCKNDLLVLGGRTNNETNDSIVEAEDENSKIQFNFKFKANFSTL